MLELARLIVLSIHLEKRSVGQGCPKTSPLFAARGKYGSSAAYVDTHLSCMTERFYQDQSDLSRYFCACVPVLERMYRTEFWCLMDYINIDKVSTLRIELQWHPVAQSLS